MKKLNFYIAFALSILALQSCETEEIGENSQTETFNDQAQPTGIYAMSIENGISKKCNNNILVFPDLETFRQTAQQLDDEWEAAIDAVNTGIDPKMSDEDYQDYLDAIGFNENQPYIDFEEAYQFCSLRKDILEKEMVWLSQQGEGKWDAAKDPDNHYIWDEERPLLNPQSEVIIKDSIGDDIIYKFFEGGYITITNNDYAELREFNLNGLPSNPDNSRFHPYGIDYDSSEFGDLVAWSNFPDFPQSGGDDPHCTEDKRHEKYFSTGSKTKIKAVDKFRSTAKFFTQNKIKAKTKYYRKKLLGWTLGRTTITANLETFDGLNCGSGWTFNPVFKTRKASKVKAVVCKSYFQQYKPKVIDNILYGTHKRRDDVVKVIDLYDGNVQ